MADCKNLYIVQIDDTVERIAAKVNVTPGQLRTLNKLSGRQLYPGQKLKLPACAVISPSTASFDMGSKCKIEKALDFQPTNVSKDIKIEEKPKFLKIKSKYFTKLHGTASGVLLITPNSIMFDPDLMHPLITEHGPADYTVAAPLHSLVSISLYEKLPADPMNVQQDFYQDKETDNAVSNDKTVATREDPKKPQSASDGRPTPFFGVVRDFSNLKNESGDVQQSFVVVDDPFATNKDSTGNEKHVQFDLELPENFDGYSPLAAEQRSESNSDHSCSGSSRVSSNDISIPSGCPSFSQLVGGVTSLRNSLKKLDVVEKTSAAHSHKSHESEERNVAVLSHGTTIKADGSCPTIAVIQAGDHHSPSFKSLELKRLKRNETVEKLLEKTREIRNQARFQCVSDDSDHPKHLFDNVENLLPYPEASLIVDIPLAEPPNYLCVKIDNKRLRRCSLDVIELPKSSSDSLNRESEKRYSIHWFTVSRAKVQILYACLLNWLPEEFDQSLTMPYEKQLKELGTSRKATKARAGNVFGFVLLQKEDHLEIGEEVSEKETAVKRLSESDYDLESDLNLNQQWEIVTVEEVKRRMSFLNIIEPDFMLLPEGSNRPMSLTDAMLDQLLRVLPPRAQGYPWILVYKSDEHGFSLNTLYRRMNNVADWSPVVLLVTDSNNVVFGAATSCPVRLSENGSCYGSGESFLFTFRHISFQETANDRYRRRHHSQPAKGSSLPFNQRAVSLASPCPQQPIDHAILSYFPWTGKNDYVINASKSGLAFGAGEGRFGLFLDTDLNRGRSDRCDTFENDCLADHKDFLINRIEAFAFGLERNFV